MSSTEGEHAVVDLVRSAEAGDREALKRLSRLRDAAALPHLLAALPDARGRHVPIAIIRALGRIGGDEAAAALARFLDPLTAEPSRNRPEQGPVGDDYWFDRDHKTDRKRRHLEAADALRKMPHTPLAADILAANNCHWELATRRGRRDPRAAEIALRYLTPPSFFGAATLALFHDPSYIAPLRRAQAIATHGWAQFNLSVARLRNGDPTAVDDLRAMSVDESHPRHVNARLMLDGDPDVLAVDGSRGEWYLMLF
ncbi:MAG TPA: hypothetical protein VFH54_16745 [Mycobacteriales bacterium]|nr:hypothetical protein [Mycobacteriales bacterium]